MRFCSDCECHRTDSRYCNKGFPQGQIDCPEFEEKDKWCETCEDCVHFDVRDHKMFCGYFNGTMASTNKGNCKCFKNKKQMITTRNPYFNAADLYSNLSKSANDAIDAMRYGWESIGNHYLNVRKEYHKMFGRNKVEKVIFNSPATIVYWSDGSKTVVKSQSGEVFDKEKGFAMACAKKFFGNKGNYYNEFRKHGADKNPIDEMYDRIFGGELSCTCEFDPGVVEQLCEIGNVTDHATFLKTELTSNGPITEQHIESSALDEKPVGDDPGEFIKKVHKNWVEEPAEKAKAERKKKMAERISIISDELETFSTHNGLEVSIYNRSRSECYEFIFQLKREGIQPTYTHTIGYDKMLEKSLIWITATIEDSVGKWLDEEKSVKEV